MSGLAVETALGEQVEALGARPGTCRTCRKLEWAGAWFWRRLAASGWPNARSTVPKIMETPTAARADDRATWTGEHCDCEAGFVPPTDLDSAVYCKRRK